jgi:hypothetical protein
MSTLGRRLSAVEAKLRPVGQARGRYEIHYKQAGHASEEDRPGQHPCGEPEHGPNCAMEVLPMGAPIRRMLVLDSPWAPLT